MFLLSRAEFQQLINSQTKGGGETERVNVFLKGQFPRICNAPGALYAKSLGFLIFNLTPIQPLIVRSFPVATVWILCQHKNAFIS